MKATTFGRIAGTLFMLVALLHVYRLFSDFPIQIGSFAVPHEASWVAALVAGALGILDSARAIERGSGLGIAAASTPHPAQARMKSLGTLTVFGLGLGLRALAVRWALARLCA